MTTRVKSLPALTLIGVMLVCVLFSSSIPARQTVAATTVAATVATTAANIPTAAPATSAAANTGSAALPSTRPTIHATLKGTEVQGIAGSYCWPDASPQCDFQDDPQPTTPINVASGDTIAFTIDPASPTPTNLMGTLLDDKTADGDLKTVDLTASEGSFTVDSTLTSGSHRLAVEAIYVGSIQGNKPFVTTVYLLTMGGTAATGAGTPAAVSTQAAAPTTAATTQPTLAVSTATPVAPTETPTTQAPVQPSVAATFIPVTAAATVATTAAPTATQVPPTVPPTVAPTIPPTTAPPTASNGTPGQPPAAVTVVVTAETSGTELPPISTATVPPLQLIVGGRNYDFIAVNACAVGAGGSTLCVNQPANANAPRVVALPNDAAQIAFQGPRPTAIQVSILTSDGVKTISSTALPPDNLSLYTLPANAGSYVLAIEITYPSGKATYYYRLDITG